MLKIKIEYDGDGDDDGGVTGAVGAIIDKALTDHGFSNVRAKILMSRQEPVSDAHFRRVSVLSPVIHPQIELRPAGYDVALYEAQIAFGYPIMSDWMREARPEVYAQPVLIDIGIEPKPYREAMKRWLEGEN